MLHHRDPTPEPGASDELPVADGEAFLGWKALALVSAVEAAGDRRLFLAPLVAGGLVDIDAEATCHQRQHPAPDVGCRCGFNAFTEPDAARRYGARTLRPYHALARVELSGTVVVHDDGARGAHQRVLGLSWPATCWGCGGGAGRLADFAPHELSALGPERRPPCSADVVVVGPTCGRCGSRARTPATVSGEAGVGCRIDDGLDPAVTAGVSSTAMLRNHLRVAGTITTFVILMAAWGITTVASGISPAAPARSRVESLAAGWRTGDATAAAAAAGDGTATYLGSVGGAGLFAWSSDEGDCRRVLVTKTQTYVEAVAGSDEATTCATAVSGGATPWAAMLSPPRR